MNIKELGLKDVRIIKDIVKIIVMRIEKEIKNGQTNSLIIAKCWNILKVICDYSDFIVNFTEAIEVQMIPMFNYIEAQKKVDFDEEIVLVVSSFIERTKKITPLQVKIFPHYNQIFNKNKHVFGHLFHCFNLYLVYGKQMFHKNPRYLEMVCLPLYTKVLILFEQIIELAIKSLNNKVYDNQQADQSEGALIFHLLIQGYSDLLDKHPKSWKVIFDATFKIMGHINQPFSLQQNDNEN